MNRNNVPRIVFSIALVFSGLASLISPSRVVVAQTNSNLVLNPGFEIQGTGGAADAANWTEGTNHARASDKFHTGGWALHSTFRGAGTATRTTAPIAVSPNTTYTYSGYIWRTNSVGGACLDMSDITGERQLCATVTGSWQFLSGTWDSGSNTSVTLRLITDGSPTGDIWFDDISLAGPGGPTATALPPTNTPVPPTITNTLPPSDTNLVSNPSFEAAGSTAADAANWTEGTNHARASDKFHTGGWALHSTFRGAGTATRTTAPIAVSPNTDYIYSGYIWRTNSVGGACLDMNDIVGERQLCTSTSGSWQFLSGTWNSGSNTSVTLRLITDGSPTGDIWFDDISLAGPGSPTATPANTNTPTKVATYTPTITPTLLRTSSPTATYTPTKIPPTITPTTPVTTGHVWYVDSLATGNNTGTSWQNAWRSFTDVNFKAMGSGDVLYISGGTASQTYTGSLKVPAGTTGITITKGIDSGHNGEVIFDGGNSTQYGVSINAEGTPVKNLVVSNLTFNNYAGAGVYGSGQNSGGLQGITVDHCKFLNFNRAGVFFEGNNNLNNNYNVVVKNSYFDDNNAGTGQSDGIYVQVLKDFTADHNYILLDNNYTGVADLHSDNIQSFWVDNVMYSNNVLVQKSNKTLGTQLLFTENGYGVHVFLNNVFIRDTPYAQDSAMRLKSANGSTFTAKVIGNTYYGKGRILNSSTVTVIKNNIFYGISQPTSSGPFYTTSSGSDVSNNIFYDPNNQFPSASGGIEVNPMFVSTDFNAIDLHLRAGSPAINAGANLGSGYAVDIEGKPRGSVWDIGAYEYAP